MGSRTTAEREIFMCSTKPTNKKFEEIFMRSWIRWKSRGQGRDRIRISGFSLLGVPSVGALYVLRGVLGPAASYGKEGGCEARLENAHSV